jgi:predicted RNA binding protein YcfA (HicA-like mRNA interferase family)
MNTIDFSKLRSITAREIISALIRDDFYLDRSKESHQHFRHPDGRRVTVAFHHPGETFRPKTLRRMIEDAGWNEEDLKRLRLME